MEKIEELAILSEIGAKVASTLDLDTILAYIMQKVKDVFNVEACSLMLLDEPEHVLRFKVSFGKGAEETRTLTVPADHGLAGWMVQEKQPLLVHDVQHDPRFYAQIDHSTGLTTRSMIGTPLLVKERVIGVLEAINKLDRAFDQNDLRLLISVATPVAQAIENARLFQALNAAYAELLQHKQQIEENRNLLRAIFDGIGDALVIVDADMNVVAANIAAARITGVTPDDLLGKPFSLVMPDMDECFTKDCPVHETFRSGRHAQRTCKGGPAKAVLRDWEIRTYPLFGEDGQVTRVVVFGRDVTEQRRLEASVVRSAKLAAVGKLAAGTAHELSNPLTAIMGNAALLHRLSPRDSSTYSLAATILEAAERSKSILRSLLDYARQDQYNFTAVDINTSLEWSVALLRYSFNESTIRLKKHLGADLPKLIASESHLRTLWTNLLLNAVDAVKAQAKKKDGFKGLVEIRSFFVPEESALRVLVHDNGVGIPEELLPRLFEPFFTTKKPSEGTGLGLYICHTIVEQHGGRIEVQSAVGQGTQFSVTLPLEGPQRA